MTLSPNLARLAPLVGTWRGQGHGEYPTIADFDYVDEWQFVDVGKPFLLFVERTWKADGTPMHTETGYVRSPDPDNVEIVAAIPTGQSELGHGTVSEEDGLLRVITDAAVRNTASAKQVDQIRRRFEVRGDDLHYEMRMAAVGQGLTLHLTANLVRQA